MASLTTGTNLRGGAVTRALTEFTTASVAAGVAPKVLDCGGGSGRFAVPLAVAGAEVTVLDISVDALATLTRRAREAGVADRITAVQGDVEALVDGTLPGGVEAAAFDLVLAHGILEAVDRPEAAFAGIVRALAPGATLSVLVDNPAAAVIARVLGGDLAAARRELDQLDTGTAGADPAAVRQWCGDAGLSVERVHGIGVFSDLIPGAALDLPGGRDELADLEARCATRSPFAEIAARVHLLVRSPGA